MLWKQTESQGRNLTSSLSPSEHPQPAHMPRHQRLELQDLAGWTNRAAFRADMWTIT